jgi:hypothetical protein
MEANVAIIPFFRRPRTRNEMRGYFATTWNDEGLRIRVRGRRRPRHLPTDYDDDWRGRHKTWKAYRHHQWRAV